MTALTDVQRKALDVLVDTFIPDLSAYDVKQVRLVVERESVHSEDSIIVLPDILWFHNSPFIDRLVQPSRA